jgi:hypothetical protein
MMTQKKLEHIVLSGALKAPDQMYTITTNGTPAAMPKL